MAAPGGEVITLQLGPYANCVGAHWWSLQELSRRSVSEIRSDVLFRRGLNLKGEETYTPRLIAVDVKGGARVEGDLDEDEESSAPAWRGNVTTHRKEPEYQPALEAKGPHTQEGGACEGGVRRKEGVAGGEVAWAGRDALWSDYLDAQLHPRSLCALSLRSHGGTGSLESFGQGQSLVSSAPHLDEIEDRLHFFSEECDYLQGFHLLCDTHNGFSGAGSRMAELLHDEYPGRGIFSFGTCPMPEAGLDVRTRTYQLMNCVLCVAAMSAHSSILCPLTVCSSLGRRPGNPAPFPHLLYDASRQYHSSAVLAVTLDTLTAPYRMSSSSLAMAHLAETLNFSGRKVMTASCSLPFPLSSGHSLPDALVPYAALPPWRGLSACEDGGPVFSQSVVLRGIPRKLQTSHLPPGTRPRSPLHSCTSGEEVLRTYLAALYPGTISVSHLLEAPCMLGPAFPQVFSRYIAKDGRTLEEPLPEPADTIAAATIVLSPAAVRGVPVMAALRAPASLRQSLLALCDEVAKADVRRWTNFSAAGVEEDDLREALNELRDLAERYRAENDRHGDA
ncbi:protein misato homolog 1, partial [Gastrophryne carolinensis]